MEGKKTNYAKIVTTYMDNYSVQHSTFEKVVKYGLPITVKRVTTSNVTEYVVSANQPFNGKPVQFAEFTTCEAMTAITNCWHALFGLTVTLK